jgi:oxygen-independent coproporphyrinogen-3 oxidase
MNAIAAERALPPLALYVHLPWCVRKCPYCDFNSHALRGSLPVDDYVEALVADLEQDAQQVEGRALVSVFFGGGTPSLFPPAAIARLLAAIRHRLPCADGIEVTLEANPGTLEHGSFAGYRSAGVTRLSLGVQSFNRDHLAAIGRIHDEQAAHVAVERAIAAGFDELNIDLMYGLPGQQVADALADVRAACAHGPTHVSHYQLTLEPGTPFHRHPPALPHEDACEAMQAETHALLREHGFERYEISAHARPGHECLHNLNYWTFGDYLGLGAGAHGKITDGERIVRTCKRRQPRAYLDSARDDGRVEERREVAPREAVFEYLLNALRLSRGFTRSQLEERTLCPIALIAPALDDAVGRGLLEATDGEGWRPTALGLRFLNDLQEMFLPDEGPIRVLAGSST